MSLKLEGNNTSCLNCGIAIQKNYCSKCGQSTNIGRITFKETISNFLRISFSIEGPLWLTFRLLILNPGKLFREYIGGKRKMYYKPVAFFILIATIYLLLRVWINFDPFEGLEANFNKEQVVLLGITFKGDEAIKIMKIVRLMEANINYQLILLIFSIAISFKLFFYKKYNLAEYTSIGMYIAGLYALVRMIAMFFDKFASVEVDEIELVFLYLLILYSSFSLFQKKNFSYIVRYVLVSTFSFILYPIFLFATVFLLFVVSLKFNL